MKIYFCDECNESIPLQDIKANKITIDEGKIYCNDCAPKGTRKDPVGMSMWIGIAGMLLCIALGMGIMAVWGDAILRRGDQQTMDERVAGLEGRLEAMRTAHEARLTAIDSDLVESPDDAGSAGKLARALRAIDANASVARQTRESAESGAKELRANLDEHGKALERLRERIEDELARLDRALTENVVEDLQRLAGGQDELKERIRLMEGRVANVEALGSGLLKQSAEATTAAAVKKETPLSPEVQKQLEANLLKLKSDKPNDRYAAAIWFMELEPPIRTRRGEQALVDTLKDASDYVVTAAIASLAEMGATWTIPHLIELLKSDNEFILDGAIEALEKLSGRDLGIVSSSEKGDILAKVRELQTWWRENRSRLE